MIEVKPNSSTELSLIAPMFNEQEVVELFFDKIKQILDSENISYEIICINDGSQDDTLSKLKQAAKLDSRIKVLNLSRNYGKEIALTAGIDHAIGNAVIPIDCDLQDPPELLLEMYKQWKNGYKVVLAKRIDRTTDSKLKRLTSSCFYTLIRKISDIDIPNNVGDFRLMDRQVVEALKRYPERSRFMKGIMASLGFSSIEIEYTRPERVAGKTKWGYAKLFHLALEGIVSFTSFPLKIWSYIGITFALMSFFYAGFLIIRTLTLGVDVPGYASLMVVVLFIGGSILLCLGIVGEYIARIFIEVKQRPMYLVEEQVNFSQIKIKQTQPKKVKIANYA